MAIDYMGMLREFHEKYGHYSSDTPGIPELLEVRMLRVRLIQEESQEFTNVAHENLVEVADALADLLYVTFGTALAYGIPIEEVFTEVHRSNMTKFTEKNQYGKTIKGSSWQPPRIKEILDGKKN